MSSDPFDFCKLRDISFPDLFEGLFEQELESMPIEFIRANYDYSNHVLYFYLRNPNSRKIFMDN